VFSLQIQPAVLKHLQHRQVFRKDFRDQFLDPGVACEQREVAQQRRADTLSLIFVNDSKSQLGRARPDDDVAATADDDASAAFFRDRDQGNVGDATLRKNDFSLSEKCLLAPKKRR
jgi:hypothetical protein